MRANVIAIAICACLLGVMGLLLPSRERRVDTFITAAAKWEALAKAQQARMETLGSTDSSGDAMIANVVDLREGLVKMQIELTKLHQPDGVLREIVSQMAEYTDGGIATADAWSGQAGNLQDKYRAASADVHAESVRLSAIVSRLRLGQ